MGKKNKKNKKNIDSRPFRKEIQERVSKKNNQFLELLNLNSKKIKILESGKIKFKKGDKIDVSSYVDASINDTKISRLEGIPSNEEIIIDNTATYRVEATANCSSITRVIDLMSSIDSTDVQTIVLPMTKKKANNLEDNDIIRWLSKSSTFVAVYSKIKKRWDELNDDDNTCYTNIMFVPKIYVFLEKKGKLRKKPIMVNLMIVAMPSINKAKNGIEATDEIEYTNRIINDTIDACIRCGSKNVVIDPYYMNALQKDVHYTARYWYGKTETQRVIENIRNITFSIDNDDLYVIFCKNKNQII